MIIMSSKHKSKIGSVREWGQERRDRDDSSEIDSK